MRTELGNKQAEVNTVAVKWKTKKNKLLDMIREAEVLNGKSIKVGVFEGEHQWLAAIHEWGCDIKPKNAQYLTVPVSPKARKKKAGDFKNLFVVESKTGEKFLARDLKGGEGKIELLFWLTKSVKIPERAFLRNGYDECIDEVLKNKDKLFQKVQRGEMSAEKFLDAFGLALSAHIKKYARDLDKPENKQPTIETKGSDNPLVDTDGMINGISWKVE